MNNLFKFIVSTYKKRREQINYIIFGGLTTLVSLGSYYFCVLLFLNPENPLQLQIANIISWICAVTFAFFTNRKYVFESNSNIITEAAKFVGSRVSTLLIDMFFMALFVGTGFVNDKIVKILVQFIVFILNYIFSKTIVFKKH